MLLLIFLSIKLHNENYCITLNVDYNCNWGVPLYNGFHMHASQRLAGEPIRDWHLDNYSYEFRVLFIFLPLSITLEIQTRGSQPLSPTVKVERKVLGSLWKPASTESSSSYVATILECERPWWRRECGFFTMAFSCGTIPKRYIKVPTARNGLGRFISHSQWRRISYAIRSRP